MIRGPDSPLESVLRLAEAAARRDCAVFVRGESGTGKELLADYLHSRSPRAGGPFIAVNCAAIAPGLMESELFGHRRGAFTGAVADQPGRIRAAEGGTLFLDEIGEMPLALQARLLRVLQEKSVCPVGATREIPVDFRLVTATHRPLETEVARGNFRADLFYRIHVVEINLPPLRERPGDIPHLLRHFLGQFLSPAEARAAEVSFPQALLEKSYPGNVRELRNLVERYAVLRELGMGWLESAGVSETLPRQNPGDAYRREPEPIGALSGRIRNSRVTNADILSALADCGHHRGKTSAALGITRRALQYRLARMVPERSLP